MELAADSENLRARAGSENSNVGCGFGGGGFCINIMIGNGGIIGMFGICRGIPGKNESRCGLHHLSNNAQTICSSPVLTQNRDMKILRAKPPCKFEQCFGCLLTYERGTELYTDAAKHQTAPPS